MDLDSNYDTFSHVMRILKSNLTDLTLNIKKEHVLDDLKELVEKITNIKSLSTMKFLKYNSLKLDLKNIPLREDKTLLESYLQFYLLKHEFRPSRKSSFLDHLEIS